MRPPYPLKEIAFQAGLSLATVDRVIHRRGQASTAAMARVEAAVAELSRQYAQAALTGKRLVIDVIMDAPARFTGAVRRALEAELPGMRPAAISARFHLWENLAAGELARIVASIRKRGSHGVLLKVPATAQNAAHASALMAAGIPVVTLVTDLPGKCRIGYVGMDNRKAGETAGYLTGMMLGATPSAILLTLSSARFAGEEEREAGFRSQLARSFPHHDAVTVSEGQGLDRSTAALVHSALAGNDRIDAVYSIGGGNRAILDAFATGRRACRLFAAHDLDDDNRALLNEGRLSFVIHHDLRHDARSACQMFLRHHRMLSSGFVTAPSRIAIATPFNMDGQVSGRVPGPAS